MLDEVSLIKNLIDSREYLHLMQLLSKPRSPNLFSKLDDIFSENCSSRFLRYFLASEEDHGLGMHPIFKLFKRHPAFASESFQVALQNTVSTEAIFNWRTPEGRYLDIQVSGRSATRSSTFVFGIENKIHASEQENQVGDYQKALDSQFPSVPKAVLFLTLDGRESLTACEDSKCRSYPISHQVLTQLLADSQKSLPVSPEVKQLLDSYLKYLIGDAEMEESIKSFVMELMKNPNHRKAIALLQTYTPDFRSFVTKQVIPEVEKATKLPTTLAWAHPASSINPHEVNLNIGTVNSLLRKKGLIESPNEGVYFMLKCGNANQEPVTIGNTFDLLLMVYGSPSSRRTEITEALGKFKFPPNIGVPRQWSPWECLWVGSSYTLKDFDQGDRVGLSTLVKEAVDLTYSGLIRNLG